jgi:hypothetical protein
MRHRLVGQLIFAVDSLATFVTSVNRQLAQRHRFVPKSRPMWIDANALWIPSNPGVLVVSRAREALTFLALASIEVEGHATLHSRCTHCTLEVAVLVTR